MSDWLSAEVLSAWFIVLLGKTAVQLTCCVNLQGQQIEQIIQAEPSNLHPVDHLPTHTGGVCQWKTKKERENNLEEATRSTIQECSVGEFIRAGPSYKIYDASSS